MKYSTRLVISLQNPQQSRNATRTSRKLKRAEEENCHKHVTDSLCYLSTTSHVIFEELTQSGSKIILLQISLHRKEIKLHFFKQLILV